MREAGRPLYETPADRPEHSITRAHKRCSAERGSLTYRGRERSYGDATLRRLKRMLGSCRTGNPLGKSIPTPCSPSSWMVAHRQPGGVPNTRYQDRAVLREARPMFCSVTTDVPSEPAEQNASIFVQYCTCSRRPSNTFDNNILDP